MADNGDAFKYHVVICAVLFGCDNSFVGLDLGDGLLVDRKSLHPKDHFDEVFSLDTFELRREYEEARLDNTTLDVACIYKEYNFIDQDHSANVYHELISNKLFTYLDNQIRIIRLLHEGPVRYKKLAIKMKSITMKVEQTDVLAAFSAIIPVGEAYNVSTIKRAHCDNIEILSVEMRRIVLPFSIEYINKSYLLYDRSYLVTLQEADLLLIASLEILFINSENNKKERLSKRCATFIFATKEERVACYKRLSVQYKKRCDFVHDGNSAGIVEEDILFLRECIRNSILKLLQIKKEKNALICDLRKEIESLDYWK